MHIVIRLLPYVHVGPVKAVHPNLLISAVRRVYHRQDLWHEFIFSSDATLFECKVRALQHFGRLESTRGAGRPGTPDRGRMMSSSSTSGSIASSSGHRRRASLLHTDPVLEPAFTEGFGQTELVKAAEVLAGYSLLNVCGGYFLDERKTVRDACVEFGLLVVSPISHSSQSP